MNAHSQPKRAFYTAKETRLAALDLADHLPLEDALGSFLRTWVQADLSGRIFLRDEDIETAEDAANELPELAGYVHADVLATIAGARE